MKTFLALQNYEVVEYWKFRDFASLSEFENFLLELIGVNLALENLGLICSYKLTEITLLYERNNNATALVTVCTFRLRLRRKEMKPKSDKDGEGTSKQIVGEGWTGLNTFIDNMNIGVGVQTWVKAKNEMVMLKKCIANGQIG
ncbi:hypothetical protein RHGRI_015013 [Rhododendron griersonianum]|uniref:Uncharacterized protein n=1 Tax=Rhododendron griersonianum TaxID=479676 RepID=A0AAV6KCG7_9ERIC|nr:hypothetical protein RHGRI_015013 [Rhododendron griersonianum]